MSLKANNLILYGSVESKPLIVKNIVGLDAEGNAGELYLQYGNNKSILLGTAGQYSISEDGSQYDGTAKAAKTLSIASPIGSHICPVYFDGYGVPQPCTYTLQKDVPSDAKFTDTTYKVATTSTAGLMSTSDKQKLDGLSATKLKYATTGLNSTTLNDFVESGIIKFGTVNTNGLYQGSSDGFIMSFGWATSANYGFQIYADDADGCLKARGKLNNKWTPWKTIAFKEDLPANEKYLPLSGGTLTGAVTINSLIFPKFDNTNQKITIKTVKDIAGTGTHLNWNGDTTASSSLITLNALAHFNGRYDANNSNLAYCNKGAFGDMATKDSKNYLGVSLLDGYYGITTAAGSKWIRTPEWGLLPYSQNNTIGSSALGSSDWYFKAAYIKNIYGNLNGNASSATTISQSGKGGNFVNLYGPGGKWIISASNSGMTSDEFEGEDMSIRRERKDGTQVRFDFYETGTFISNTIKSINFISVDAMDGKTPKPIGTSRQPIYFNDSGKLATCDEFPSLIDQSIGGIYSVQSEVIKTKFFEIIVNQAAYTVNSSYPDPQLYIKSTLTGELYKVTLTHQKQ